MSRRILAILCCIPLFLALCTGALWIHSQETALEIQYWPQDHTCVILQSSNGRIRVTRVALRTATKPQFVPRLIQTARSLQYMTPKSPRFSEFGWRRQTGINSPADIYASEFDLGIVLLCLLALPAGSLVWLAWRQATSPAKQIELDQNVPRIERVAALHEPAGDIECPICDYNLRGLTQPRCPECGYTFSWAQLLDPSQRFHPYLFEHARHHSLRALFKTLTRNFEPNRFWKSLKPSQQPNPNRLLAYAGLCMLIALSPAIVEAIVMARWRIYGTSPSVIQNLASMLTRNRPAIVSLSLLLAFYPFLTWLSLMIFQQTMRKVKVKSGHALRCAIYSADAIVWGALWAWIAILVTLFIASPMAWNGSIALAQIILMGIILTMAITFLRLHAAYKYYMKFPDAFATVLLSQFAVILLLTTIMVYSIGMLILG
jgi:hypothetical protein